MLNKKMNVFDYLNYLFMTLLCLTMIYPFLHTFSLSFSDPIEASKGGFMFWPRGFQLDTYKGLLKDTLFWRSYLNIAAVTAIGVVGCLFLTSCASYVLSLPHYPFRRFFTMFIVFTMFFSGGIIPSYLLTKDLHLMNTWIPLWVPGLVAAFNIILLINFFKQIPSEVREAAVIDGASDFAIFTRIVLPLSKPVLATVALFLAVMFWNDWFTPYLYLNDTDKYTLPLILKKYVVNSEIDGLSGFVKATNSQVLPSQVRSTVILVGILPTLLIYPFIQKYFVKGVTLGSLKG
ncbi:carbohydrate ABC transporter permease [Paenibacillus sp. OV219]|uniref:carbohydrate ABC transporter permease n=1 Tax=Paenibacillus sp. OV219 TaxID=1884377 RepID=UPI0008D16680|nr:carbohydrate ABC transporter permease [Paenibacillus sp. OV219]SEO96899.1 carbohydrate ABC transporter membrane protein 2, CUT1 family [Paenibacillus sp. OV219]